MINFIRHKGVYVEELFPFALEPGSDDSAASRMISRAPNWLGHFLMRLIVDLIYYCVWCTFKIIMNGASVYRVGESSPTTNRSTFKSNQASIPVSDTAIDLLVLGFYHWALNGVCSALEVRATEECECGVIRERGLIREDGAASVTSSIQFWQYAQHPPPTWNWRRTSFNLPILVPCRHLLPVSCLSPQNNVQVWTKSFPIGSSKLSSYRGPKWKAKDLDAAVCRSINLILSGGCPLAIA